MPITLDFTVPHVLRNADEHEAAVAEIDALLDEQVDKGTPAWERLRFLAVLVQAYEDDAFPLDERMAGGTPQSAVEFMLSQRGMTRIDLTSVFGSKSRVSEFFSGHRPLSKAQVLGLRAQLGIPADLLLTA